MLQDKYHGYIGIVPPKKDETHSKHRTPAFLIHHSKFLEEFLEERIGRILRFFKIFIKCLNINVIKI